MEPQYLEVARNQKTKFILSKFWVIEVIQNMLRKIGNEKKIWLTETSKYRKFVIRYRGSSVLYYSHLLLCRLNVDGYLKNYLKFKNLVFWLYVYKNKMLKYKGKIKFFPFMIEYLLSKVFIIFYRS